MHTSGEEWWQLQFGRAPQERDAIVRVVSPEWPLLRISHLQIVDVPSCWVCVICDKERRARRERPYVFSLIFVTNHLKIIPVNLARTGRIPCFFVCPLRDLSQSVMSSQRLNGKHRNREVEFDSYPPLRTQKHRTTTYFF